MNTQKKHTTASYGRACIKVQTIMQIPQLLLQQTRQNMVTTIMPMQLKKIIVMVHYSKKQNIRFHI